MNRRRDCCGCCCASRAQVCADDDDDQPQPSLQPDSSGAYALTTSQQQAVGIRIDHPMPMASPQQVEAYGLVLDPVALVSDAGRVDSTRAAAAAAAADVARLDGLYRNNADASLKALQASRAQAAEAAAQAQSAATTFRLQWGPVAALDGARRGELIDALVAGRRLLLRADVPGHQLLGNIAPRALVIVDGISVAARVLGPLPRTDPQSQSAAGCCRSSTGRRAWARRARRSAAAGRRRQRRAGARRGAAVRRSRARTSIARSVTGSDSRSTRRRRSSCWDAWAMAGWSMDWGAADSIVVQGAGVLWSLEGISTFSAAEEEHD
jgi:hypothetical protein